MALSALITEYNDKHGLNQLYQTNSEINNLCVHGDTEILTYQGYKKIKDLTGKLVAIWNGEHWSPSQVSQTGENQLLLKVTTSDGIELQCTPYHKFILSTGKSVEAQQLQINDCLMKCNTWPMIDGVEELNENEVPINASIHDKRRWLALFIDQHKSTDAALSDFILECSSNQLAMSIKLLCNTIGCSPSVYCDEWTSQVIFSPKDTYYLFQIMRLRSKYRNMETGINPNVTNHITISSIKSVDGLHNIYHIDEPLKHMGVFNGLLTKT